MAGKDTSPEEGFEAASARLDRAMGRLDASMRSLNSRMRVLSRIEQDAHKLMGERAKWIGDAEKEKARARRLDEGAGEVSRRLVEAMETVRQVLNK